MAAPLGAVEVKHYTPEENGQITLNGKRQRFEEQLSVIEDYTRTIARCQAIVQLTEDPATRRHIAKLEKRYAELRYTFKAEWDRRSST